MLEEQAARKKEQKDLERKLKEQVMRFEANSKLDLDRQRTRDAQCLAAMKIQFAFRSHAARKELANLRQVRHDEENAAKVIQRGEKRRVAALQQRQREESKARRQADKVEFAKRVKALEARKQLEAKALDDARREASHLEEQNKAATQIQSMLRCPVARNVLKEKQQEQYDAAVRIQKVQRGR